MDCKICILLLIALYRLVSVFAYPPEVETMHPTMPEEPLGPMGPRKAPTLTPEQEVWYWAAQPNEIKNRISYNYMIFPPKCDCSLKWFSSHNSSVDLLNDKSRLRTIGKVLKGFLECKLNFTEQIKQTADNITEEEQRDLELLTSDLIKASEEDDTLFYKLFGNNLNEVPSRELEDVKEKLAKKFVIPLVEDSKLEGKAGRAQMIEEISPKIELPCVKTYKGLEQIIGIFYVMNDLKQLNETNTLDDFSRKWLIRGRACKLLIRENSVKNICTDAFIKNYLAEHEPERKLHEEWDELRLKVFNGDNSIELSSPADLQTHLNRLAELSDTLEPVGLLNLQDEWNARGLKDLIWLGEVSETKCNQRIFEKFHTSKIINKAYPTILEYLRHFGVQQFSICKNNFIEQLDAAIGKLTEEQRHDIEVFTNHSLHSESCRSSRMPNIVDTSQGALDLMKAKGFKITKKTKGTKIGLIFLDTLDDLCKDVPSKIKEIIGFYESSILPNKDLEQLVDEKVYDWVLRSRICNLLHTDRGKIIGNVRSIVYDQSKEAPKSFFKSFFKI